MVEFLQTAFWINLPGPASHPNLAINVFLDVNECNNAGLSAVTALSEKLMVLLEAFHYIVYVFNWGQHYFKVGGEFDCFSVIRMESS